MARKQKGAAQAAPTQDTGEAMRLLDEAMGEMERLSKRSFELEKIACQLGSLDDLAHLLWEARTIRLIADPEDGESTHKAIARRFNLSTEEAAKFYMRAEMRSQVAAGPTPGAAVEGLLAEATAEIERLTKELEASRAAVAGALPGNVETELRGLFGAKDGEALIEAANRVVEDKLVTPEEWKQIREFCGDGVDDAVGVIEILKDSRQELGDEVANDSLDAAIESRLAGREENIAKVEVFDDLIENKLDGVIADAIHAALEQHECPLRQVWERLSPFDRKRVIHEAQKHADNAVAELGAGVES